MFGHLLYELLATPPTMLGFANWFREGSFVDLFPIWHHVCFLTAPRWAHYKTIIRCPTWGVETGSSF